MLATLFQKSSLAISLILATMAKQTPVLSCYYLNMDHRLYMNCRAVAMRIGKTISFPLPFFFPALQKLKS